MKKLINIVLSATLMFAFLGCNGNGTALKEIKSSIPESTQEATPIPIPTPEPSPAHFEFSIYPENSKYWNVIPVAGEEYTVFYNVKNTGDLEGEIQYDILFDGTPVEYYIWDKDYNMYDKISIPGHSDFDQQSVFITSDTPGEHKLQIADLVYPIYFYSKGTRPKNGYTLMESTVPGKHAFVLKNIGSKDMIVFILKDHRPVAARYLQAYSTVKIQSFADGEYRVAYTYSFYDDPIWVAELNRFDDCCRTYANPLMVLFGTAKSGYEETFTFEYNCKMEIDAGMWRDNVIPFPEIPVE